MNCVLVVAEAFLKFAAAAHGSFGLQNPPFPCVFLGGDQKPDVLKHMGVGVVSEAHRVCAQPVHALERLLNMAREQLQQVSLTSCPCHDAADQREDPEDGNQARQTHKIL